jgi:hypothetical protein
MAPCGHRSRAQPHDEAPSARFEPFEEISMNSVFKTLAIVGIVCAAAAGEAAPFSDEFSGTTLDPRWVVGAPNPNSNVRLDGHGHLVMVASPLNGGSDLYPGPNNNGTVLLQPIGPDQDWTIQTSFSVDLLSSYQGAGILLTNQLEPLQPPGFTRLAELQYMLDPPGLHLCFRSCDPLDTQEVTLKVHRKGANVSGSYSLDHGKTWVPLGTIAYSFQATYIGLSTTRQPYDQNYGLYTKAVFNYFRVHVPTAAEAAGDD